MKATAVLLTIPERLKAGARAALHPRTLMILSCVLAALTGTASTALAQAHNASSTHQAAGEANLKLPDLSQVKFLGVDGHTLLLFGLVICALGLLFGLAIYIQLKNLPVHKAMREISELIYETCKT